MRVQLVLLIGLQASGKSTFYRQHFAESHVLVSKDLWPNARKKQERMIRILRETLEQGRSVVVDNTNPSRAVRSPLIALAREFGAECIGYYFSSQLSECLARNASRQGKARVSEVGMKATAAELQLPSPEEGFDQLFYVHQLEGGFDVQNFVG